MRNDFNPCPVTPSLAGIHQHLPAGSQLLSSQVEPIPYSHWTLPSQSCSLDLLISQLDPSNPNHSGILLTSSPERAVRDRIQTLLNNLEKNIHHFPPSLRWETLSRTFLPPISPDKKLEWEKTWIRGKLGLDFSWTSAQGKTQPKLLPEPRSGKNLDQILQGHGTGGKPKPYFSGKPHQGKIQNGS